MNKPTIQQVTEFRLGSFPLSTEVLSEACDILYGKEWKPYLVPSAKAAVMMGVLVGRNLPCIEFKKWFDCITFLSKHIQ